MPKNLENLDEAVKKLHKITLSIRWLVVAVCWLLVVPVSLWQLRDDIALMTDYFTWSALRYSLIYHLVPAFFLFLSIGITVAVLLRHSQYVLWGILPKERKQLEQQVKKIHRLGHRHPLWKRLFC